MENNQFQFKTSMNYGGCVAKVKTELDKATGIISWNVDTNNPDKILTISSNGISPEEVMRIVQGKGFNIELIRQ